MNDIESIKGAVDFLMYSYFGLSFLDGQEVTNADTIIDKAILLAYIDATNQGAFNTLEKVGNDIEDSKKKGIAIIYKAIIGKENDPYSKLPESIKNTELVLYEDYNNHSNVCNALCEVFKNVTVKNTGEKAFTFGNAQKWLNMTVKYIYIFYQLFHAYYPECAFWVK